MLCIKSSDCPTCPSLASATSSKMRTSKHVIIYIHNRVRSKYWTENKGFERDNRAQNNVFTTQSTFNEQGVSTTHSSVKSLDHEDDIYFRQVGSQLTPLTLDMVYLNHSPQAGGHSPQTGGYGPSGPEPPATRTVPFPLLLDS